MKKKEKIERLTTISYGIPSEEKLEDISKKWSHKGLDFLTEMWNKYYFANRGHEFITYILYEYGEKQLNLEFIEKILDNFERTK